MKVAWIVPGGFDRSGRERVIPCLLWLAERLAGAGIALHVFTLHQEPRAARWRLAGADIHNIGRRPLVLRTLAALGAEHRRGRFDLVHAFWAAGPGSIGAWFKRLARIPLVVTLPGADLIAIAEIGYGAQLGWRGRARVRRALAGADRVLAPSQWLVDQARGFGVAAQLLPYGVALDRWPARAPRRRDPAAPLRLLHVADLAPVKDQATLLQAMRLLGNRGVDARLDVVGLDSLGGAVQRRAAALGLAGRVQFHGFLPHPETRPLFERADLLVMSSRHEGAGIVLLEAAVAGLAAVGTRVGLFADWAGVAAEAVPVGDAAALAEAIARLAGDEARRMELAAAAQARALATDADWAAERLVDLYRTLARR